MNGSRNGSISGRVAPPNRDDAVPGLREMDSVGQLHILADSLFRDEHLASEFCLPNRYSTTELSACAGRGPGSRFSDYQLPDDRRGEIESGACAEA